MDDILNSLGANITASIVYDYVKSLLRNNSFSKVELEREVKNFLELHGANIDITGTESIVELMALEGIINIENTKIKSEGRVVIGSAGTGSSNLVIVVAPPQHQDLPLVREHT